MSTDLDVAVVGGSIAGCVTAIRFARMGHQVAIFDKRAMDDRFYKKLCTHFIQPHAVPVLAELGLAHLYQREWSVKTKAVFVTPGGLIEGPGNYLPDSQDLFALNLERSVLDPVLRQAARDSGVRFLDGTAVEGVDEGTVTTGDGTYRAKLVVAADGRRSRLATLLGNPTEQHPNDRSALFAYYSGITTRADDRCVFIMNDHDLACVYPLVGGRTQFVLFAEKSKVAGWDDRSAGFLDYFAGLPDAPPVDGAVPEMAPLGYTDYPNQVRQPVVGQVPFVGDAALSLDPMAGVGCGFALVSGDLLARAFTDRPLDDLAGGLADYRQRYESVLLPHAEGIIRDSRVDKDDTAQQKTFGLISGNPKLSQKYLALTGRMVHPDELKRDLMLALMTQRRPAKQRA